MEGDPDTPDENPPDAAADAAAGESSDASSPHPLSYADPSTPSRVTPTLAYATPGSPKLKTIRQLASFEANLAAAKLQSAGITCFVIDDNIATAYPLVFASVKLQVPETEMEQAEAVLAAPAAIPADPEDDEAAADEAAAAGDEAQGDYVAETFRCPNCHRKDVELMPLSATMRNIRLGCLMVLLLPVIVSVAARVFSSGGSRGGSADLLSPEAMLAWVVVLETLCFIVLTAKRRKHCRTCDHEWIG